MNNTSIQYNYDISIFKIIIHYNNNGVGLFPGHASLAYFFFCGSVSLPNIGMVVATGDDGLSCFCTFGLTAGNGCGSLSVGLRTGGAADIVRVVNKLGDRGSVLNPLTAEVGEICSLLKMSSYSDGFGSSYLFCLLVGDIVSEGDVGNGSFDVFCR